MYFEKQHFYSSSAWLLTNTLNAKNKTENPCNRRLKCTNTWSKMLKQKHVTTADSFLFLTLKALNELGKRVCCEHISWALRRLHVVFYVLDLWNCNCIQLSFQFQLTTRFLHYILQESHCSQPNNFPLSYPPLNT